MACCTDLSAKKPLYRGRFAPSPTGPLHIGSLYTAVASFLQARSQQGQWLLRIDDLDPFRCKTQYSQQIINTLERYSLHWDEPIVYQSERHHSYRAALQTLQQQGRLYPCQCSRKDLANRQSASTVYDRHCLTQRPSANQTCALRLRLNAEQISFKDRVQGLQRQDLAPQVGDFVIFRKDQVYAYHLAAIIDDDEQGVSEVLRGSDLLDSSFRQILLQQLLSIEAPLYAHIPTINDAYGAKLSKQTFAADVALSPVRETLIQVMGYLNLQPPKELLDLEPSEILNWAIPRWSIDKIKPETSILF